MVRKFNRTLSLLLVLAMMVTYVAPWKALAIGGKEGGADVSHENYFGDDGLYHVWSQELSCTDESHHAHTDECYENEEPQCGEEESDFTITCTIPEEHEHSDSCYTQCTKELNPDHYYYGWHRRSDTGCRQKNGSYYFLSCTMPTDHLHGETCYTAGHTHTDECYVSTEPQCGMTEHTEDCFTWNKTTYSYFTVTFVPNNGSENTLVRVVPELPEELPGPSDCS